MEVQDRGIYTESKLDNFKNNFNCKIPLKPNHREIFNRFIDMFRPADKLTQDIKDIVTHEDFNLCRNKNIVVIYQGSLNKLRTLQFYMTMNFLSNWMTYNNYIFRLIPGYLESLRVETISLESIIEVRFREDNERLNYIYKELDIMFLTVSSGDKRLCNNYFYNEVAGNVINIRASNNLVTIVIYFGNELQYKKTGIEENIFSTKHSIFIINDAKSLDKNIEYNKTTKSSKSNNITDEEVF